jgi:chromosome segregation ATPase
VEKEKDSYGKKATLANSKYLESLEEIKLKGNLISEYQKKNLETENKLKEQQKLYESVRSDRNTYSKNLSETDDEIAETKRRYKIVNHQINQLKEEIEAKEVALAKERFEHKKKDQTLLDHSRELEARKKDKDENQERIKNIDTEISKLHTIIKNSEDSRQKKKDEYELVVAERDILGTQLIRRNDESALLYEKIKIQQTTLAKGETAFRERLNDLKLLGCKKSDLKRELRILMKEGKKIPKFKDEIYLLQSELIEEKLKVKALSEELENPLNVHRCRNLEGTDPDFY